MAAAADNTIAMFGATGGAGKIALKLFLEKGWHVRALVRTPSKVESKSEKLTLVQGSFSDADKIEECITGASYVISMGGAVAGKDAYPEDMMLNFVKILHPLMDKLGTKTFIYTGGALANLPGERNPCSLKVLRCMLGCVAGLEPSLLDHEKVFEYMLSSGMLKAVVGVKAIVFRPTLLNEGPSTGMLTADPSPQSGGSQTIDVAQLYLDSLTNESLFGTFPYVTYSKGTSGKSAGGPVELTRPAS